VLKINKFTIQNFKSIQERTIPLKKFTIFIGPNSSGKSSFLQSILILKRTLSKKPHPFQFVTKTDSLELGEFKDIVTHHNLSREITFRINEEIDCVHGIGSKTPVLANVWYELSSSNQGFEQVRFGGNIDDYEINFKSRNNEETTAYCRSKSHLDPEIVIEDARREGVHPRMHSRTKDTTATEALENVDRFNKLFINGEFTEKLLQDFHYIPFSRVATNFAEITSRYDADVLSAEQRNLIQFLINNLIGDPDLTDKVNELMHKLTGKKIRTRTHDFPDSKGVALEFIKEGISNAITNEGTGPNQAILLLTILVGTRKKSVIAIDEPEIHLHPAAQTKLAKIMIDLGLDEDKQILFTTHSEHMIFPFLSSIASKKDKSLSLNDLAIYYTTIDERTHTTNFEELKINESGQIEGGLKGFYDADLELLEEFLE